MARPSKVCFDKSRNSYYCRHNGKKHYLGVERAEAHSRFAKIIGADTSKAPLTVARAIEAFLVNHGGPWHRQMLGAWSDFVGALRLSRLGLDHLDEYLSYLQGLGLAPQTVQHKLRAAVRVCRWCDRRGYLDTMPEIPKTPPPVKRARDCDQATLIKAFSTLGTRAGRILRFILETGARPGEACGLLWSVVDIDRGVCILAAHKTARRTGRVRTLYLSPAAVKILEETPHEGDHVFLSTRGRPYTPDGLHRILSKRGIPGAYALRHTRAQSMLDAGVPIAEIAEHLGHSDLATVLTYARVRKPRALEVARNLVSPLLPAPRARTRRRKARGS